MRRREPWRRLRRAVAGQAGTGPAWALAVVALLGTLVAVAGPRAIEAGQTAALQRRLSTLSPLSAGFAVTAQWQPFAARPPSMLTEGQDGDLARQVAAAMRPPVISPAGQRWTGAVTPAAAIPDPAHRAIAAQAPELEVAYRPDLAHHARLLSGSFPAAAPGGPARVTGPGRAACPAASSRRAVTLPVAVTAATAARFVVHRGSRISLCPFQGGDPAVSLLVTGVVRPLHPSSGFWRYDPLVASPSLLDAGNTQARWGGGVIAGPGELTALQAAFSGASFQGVWYYPLATGRITIAALPRLLSGITRLANSSAVANVPHAPFPSVPLASSGLQNALGGFLQEQRAVIAIDSLLAVGLFVAALILLLVCAGLVAGAHEAELTLVRARGGSTAQVAARLGGRTCRVSVPAVAAGAVVAVVAVPGGATTASWVLGGIAALTATAGPAAMAAWTHRRARPAKGTQAGGGQRLARLRRLAAELAVLGAAAGALVGLRGQGVSGGAGPYLSASPVLVAAAAGLAVARVYPAVVRALLGVAAPRRGAVAFLSLARSGRSRLTALAPALVLVLTLTLAAFAAVLAGSVAAGQVAASWRQAGADAVAQAAGDGVVTAAARRSAAAVSGVTHDAAVYVAPGNPQFDPAVVDGAAPAPGRAPTVGLVVVDPARYAALAAATPWPSFPAPALARPAAGTGGAVPVLASAGVAAAASRPGAALVLDGVRLPIRVAGRIGVTPAMPSGGTYVVMPAWAQARFPSIAGPDVLLVTGSHIGVPALRAALAAHMPRSVLTLRRQVLAGLAASPAQRAGALLYVLAIWAAAALSVVAVLSGLAVSARERRRLMTRLAALGMSTRQARALALADTVPLLAVAVGGMVGAVSVLTALAGPALNLTVFTGSTVPVPVRPGVAALAIPAAAAIVLAAATVVAERAASRWHAPGPMLRREEAV